MQSNGFQPEQGKEPIADSGVSNEDKDSAVTFSSLIIGILEDLVSKPLWTSLKNVVPRAVKIRLLLGLLTWILPVYFQNRLRLLTTAIFVFEAIRMIPRELLGIIWEIATRDEPPEIDPIIEILSVSSVTATIGVALLVFLTIGHLEDFLSLLRYFISSSGALVLFGNLAASGVLFKFFREIGEIVVRAIVRLIFTTPVVPVLLDMLCSVWDNSYLWYSRLASRKRPCGSTYYVYRPLRTEENEIRLIQICKSSPFSRPQYSLFSTPLETAPPFDAISYTWDDQRRDKPIAFLEGTIMTTTNVARILQQRRSCLRTAYVWIDAVCINQNENENEEKEQQMALMARIYARARRTLIWLNNDNPRPSEAMRVAVIFFIIDTVSQYFLGDKDVLNYVCLFLLAPGRCPSLDRFLNISYWRRAWVIQEIARGRKVHIMYANQLLDLEYVVAALQSMIMPPFSDHVGKNDAVAIGLEAIRYEKPEAIRTEKHEATRTEIPEARRSENPEATRTKKLEAMMADFVKNLDGQDLVMSLDRIRRKRSKGPANLHEALEWFAPSEAKEQRDKIFALRDLVLDDSDSKSPLARALRVDYCSGTPEIFARVARHLLSTNPDYLFKKSGTGWKREVPGLPSWVPDWTQKQITMDLDEIPYHAGGSGKFAFEFLDRNRL
jgi:energy-converting hydrogenase Eha subunit E